MRKVVEKFAYLAGQRNGLGMGENGEFREIKTARVAEQKRSDTKTTNRDFSHWNGISQLAKRSIYFRNIQRCHPWVGSKCDKEKGGEGSPERGSAKGWVSLLAAVPSA
jgi:hypothetical protein